jgi:lysozyme
MAFVSRGFAVIAAASVLLIASAGGHLAHSLGLRDVKPHKGVAAAHTMPVQGIDVSYWQGDIDWNQVRASGIKVAYI